MSHFAKIDNNKIITEVIVAEQDFINSGAIGDSFRWIQTSYNNNFRKNYAKVGGTYDVERDAFIPPKPYASWTLNESTCQWEAPVAHPNDGKKYEWNEATTSWDEVVNDIPDRPSVAYPNDGKLYMWNPATTSWDEDTLVIEYVEGEE